MYFGERGEQSEQDEIYKISRAQRVGDNQKKTIMLVKLIRNQPQGKALFGQLYVDGTFFCDTLENTDYAIPSGFYRLRVTMSPRFNIFLPILDGVWGYRKDYVSNDNTDNLRGNQYPCHAQSEHNPLPLEGVDSSGNNRSNECEIRILSPLSSINTSTLRTGIRIHAGNTIDHTEGCILVGEADLPNLRLLSSLKTLHRLCDVLLNHKNTTNDETYIEVSESDPYPLYDVLCPRELQER